MGKILPLYREAVDAFYSPCRRGKNNNVLEEDDREVKSARCRSQLEACCESSQIEELWYSEIVCLWITIYIHINTNNISLVGRVFANGPGDLGSIPGRVIPKTFKMVLDTSLLNTQQYKTRIEGKMEQYKERSSALPYTSV